MKNWLANNWNNILTGALAVFVVFNAFLNAGWNLIDKYLHGHSAIAIILGSIITLFGTVGAMLYIHFDNKKLQEQTFNKLVYSDLYEAIRDAIVKYNALTNPYPNYQYTQRYVENINTTIKNLKLNMQNRKNFLETKKYYDILDVLMRKLVALNSIMSRPFENEENQVAKELAQLDSGEIRELKGENFSKEDFKKIQKIEKELAEMIFGKLKK